MDAIRGEYLDLLAAAGPAPIAPPRRGVRRVGALKAGSYTVVGPLLIGAALAGRRTPSVDATLRAFGEPLGEAFQLRDDVLGTFGEPDVTGKDPDDDLREGKQTLLVAVGPAAVAEGAAARSARRAGRPSLTGAGAERARAVVRGERGALGRRSGPSTRLRGQARAAIDAARRSTPRSARRSLDALATSSRSERAEADPVDPRRPAACSGTSRPCTSATVSAGRNARTSSRCGSSGCEDAIYVVVAAREPGAPQPRARPSRDAADRSRAGRGPS